MSLERGAHVGPYEIVMRLGAGGMGEVFRARDPRLGRDVAIKILREETARDRDLLRRFVAEARAASALNHPNILTVHEIGESEYGPYIVTELVEGETVRSMISAEPLPVARALDILIQAGEGIAKAHEAGIVHRDLKPENLMVTRDGLVKILDFGLAKLEHRDELGIDPGTTASGMIVGTAAYLSPEQLRGGRADARSDVFALAVGLYEMVAGENPFRRDNAVDTFSAILRDEPPPLSQRRTGVPEALSEVVARGLAKKPEDRFPSARAFVAALRRVQAELDESVPAGRTAASPVAVPVRRRKWLPAVAALSAAVALAAVFLSRRASSPAGAAPSAPLPAGRLAVAVLPMRDQSGDPELAKADVGSILSDAFVQVLSDFPNVYVVSPNRLDSVARSLGRPVGDTARDLAFAREVCEKAGAGAMLAGNLSHVGNTFLLNVSLTELPSDRLVGSFRAESQGTERLLPELTGAVTEGLRRKVGGSAAGPGGGVEHVATGSVDAYAHFIRGNDLEKEGNWKEAIPELEKAVSIDPEMAVAWSELACAFSFAGDDAQSRAAQKKAEEFLERANGKERHWIALSGVWVNSGNAALYRKESEKFIRDFPDDREGYFYAGLGAEYLESNCRDALVFYEKAYVLTPNYYPVVKAIVDCRSKLGQKQDAVKILKRYLALPMLSAHGRQQAKWRLEELAKKG